MSAESERPAPWQDKLFDGWSIVGMNHYFVAGRKQLYVAMVKDGRCIKAEGDDDQYLWNRLAHQVWALERPKPPEPNWCSWSGCGNRAVEGGNLCGQHWGRRHG